MANCIIWIVSDVVWQGAISSVFWLVIILVIAVAFRRELQSVLSSISSFKIAGATIDLQDKRANIESWVILTNILVEILSKRESLRPLSFLLSNASARQLGKFALRYAKESRGEDKDVELLRNIAYVVGIKGNTTEAFAIYETLLEQLPGDQDLLNLKGSLLLETENEKYYPTSEQIFEDLVMRYPVFHEYWYNLALTRSKLGKFDESLHDLLEAIHRGLRAEAFDHKGFKSLREARPEEFARLLEM